MATPDIAVFSWIVALAAAWFAVEIQPWALTLFLAAMGGLYLVAPLPRTFPRSLLLLAGLLLLLAATAFLPAAWLGTAIRKPFQAQGINLPWTYSPQPWWSLEDLTLLLASLLWAWNCFEAKLSLPQRQLLLNSYLLGLGFVAVMIILRGTSMGRALPPLLQATGQFENRNQTGDLLFMGGIFSFVRVFSKAPRGELAKICWMLMTFLFLAAIIRNGSRAALALFGLGVLVASCLMLKLRRRRTATWIALVLVATVGTLLFIFDGAGLPERFQVLLNGHESRLAIYQDTAAMLGRQPWFGVGLGNFEGVFNTMRTHSTAEMTRMTHPESDWWWIASELGIVGVILAGLLVALAFRIYGRAIPGSNLTKGSIIVAALFLLHSLFDVGGHRLGALWPCLYLVGLGVSRPASPTDLKLPRLALRAVGLLMLLIAALRLQSMSLDPWMPTHASLAAVEKFLPKTHSLPEQTRLLDRSIAWAPLDWELYYQRALITLHASPQPGDSDADFNRALYLEQNTVDLPIAIGEVCRATNLPEAMVAWREVLRRAGDRRESLWGYLYSCAGDNLKARLQLTTLAQDYPELQLVAVIAQRPDEFEWYRQNLLESDPSLSGSSPVLLKQLFDRWAEVGDVNELIQDWPQHPEWRSAGWRAYARALAKAGRYHDAVATVLALLPARTLPVIPGHRDLDDATRQYLSDPKDPFNGIMLYLAQISAGQKDQAFQTLTEIAQLPQPPPYVSYLFAKGLFQKNQDEAAWHALEPLLNEK